MSLAPSLTQTSLVGRGRTGFIALWVVQIALAGMFLLAGGSKLLGAAPIIGGSPAMPAILLIGSAVVVWARRHQLLGDQPTVRRRSTRGTTLTSSPP
jgi:hypothetical protein